MIAAAQYVRMSTERQDVSIDFQIRANASFAAGRGYTITRTYADEGISGVSLKNRSGLKRLIADVSSGASGYGVILVYDVSRWGRFQNPDEAAHYEFLCAEVGVRIEYTAEPFANDGSAMSSLLKSVKRVMAAEYSRELSTKVAAALATLAARGYWTGGTPGYGFRRESVSRTGQPLAIQGFGQWKPQGCHTRLVLGPPEEVATVRRIYQLFVSERLSLKRIAERLNSEGSRTDLGRPWSAWLVRAILGSPKYTGTVLHGRTRSRFGQATRNDRRDWRYIEGAAPQIVSKRLWMTAQREMQSRTRPPTRDELLADLRRLAKRYRHVTAEVVRHHGRYRVERYRREFGFVTEALELAGCPVNCRQMAATRRQARCGTEYASRRIRHDAKLLADLRRLFVIHGRLSHHIIREAPGVASPLTYAKYFGGLQRAYALVGFIPEGGQRRMMSMHTRWSYPEEAEVLAHAATATARDGFRYRPASVVLLEQLRALLAKEGRLTRKIIDGAEELPNAQAFVDRFGSLARVYQLVGYTPAPHQTAMLNVRGTPRDSAKL